MNDPRETREPNTRLGIPTSWIFRQAIGGGQASFDEPLGELSAKDRVLLYAFFNQKSHVNELVHAFEKLLTTPRDLYRATVIDIGCGPFTSGLALMASPNSPTRGHPKFPQAAQPNYDVSGLMAKRAAASLSL
jgi:hypothetical protein